MTNHSERPAVRRKEAAVRAAATAEAAAGAPASSVEAGREARQRQAKNIERTGEATARTTVNAEQAEPKESEARVSFVARQGSRTAKYDTNSASSSQDVRNGAAQTLVSRKNNAGNEVEGTSQKGEVGAKAENCAGNQRSRTQQQINCKETSRLIVHILRIFSIVRIKKEGMANNKLF